MATKEIVEGVEIPAGTSVNIQGKTLTIKGKKGTVTRSFDYPTVSIKVENNQVIFSAKSTKREKTMIKTFKAHLRNSFKGSNESYIYKLKICSGHFPMNVAVVNGVLQVKNFLGEKVPREVKLKPDAKVTIEGAIIIVESSDKEKAGQVAADIEQATRRPGFDRRIFQDGIYIIEKAGQVI